MKMLGGYMELFMKPELATMYLSIKRELEELVQKKVYIWSIIVYSSQVFTVNQTFMLSSPLLYVLVLQPYSVLHLVYDVQT